MLNGRAQSGYSLVLVMLAISLLTLEVSFLANSLNNSLGVEGVLAAENTLAREGLSTAFTRLNNSLYSYLATNGTSAVDTAFAQGGASALTNVTLTTTNPESGASNNTSIVISAWVQSRRGNSYQLRATSTVGGVTLTGNRWVTVAPPTSSSGGTLTTIGTTGSNPVFGTWYYHHHRNHAAPYGGKSNTSRVFFVDDSGLKSWSASSGLSTLVSVSGLVSHLSWAVDPNTERVYFGQSWSSSANFWTWQASTGLSTLLTSRPYVGLHSTHLATALNGVYLGELANPGNFYFYNPSSGFSTILSARPSPGGANSSFQNSMTVVNQMNGRVIFGEDNGTSAANIYTWHPSTGLSTIASSITSRPGGSVPQVVNSLDWYYFGSSCCVYFWSPSAGLSTIISGKDRPGLNSLLVDQNTGRAYFGGGWSENFFYTWHPSSGLSTLGSSTSGGIGYESSHIDPVTGRVFYGHWNTGSAAPLLTWHISTGLSTVISGRNAPGRHGILMDGERENYIFKDYGPTNGYIYLWNPTSGLSTLAQSSTTSGTADIYPSFINLNTGRAYFHNGLTSNAVLTWAPTTGLSTLISNLSLNANIDDILVDPLTGDAFFFTQAAGWGAISLHRYVPPESGSL